MHNRLVRGLVFVASLAGAWALAPGAVGRARAAPPVPSGPHPRLFMSASNLAAFKTNVQNDGSLAARLVDLCADTVQMPQWFTERGGSGGGVWPEAALACAFSYLTTQNAQHLTQAIKYWRAALNDDQEIGDNLGCVAGVSTAPWNGNGSPPPAIITITHDTGYPMRWYGPYVALVYDWLSGAPGVDAALLAQTRTCLTAWIDHYTNRGYHNEEAGGNYNAGFVIGKTLAGIAIGNDGGADGHIWNETADELFPNLLIGDGLEGQSGAFGTPAGALVGGDWPEGWQYGPLSVVEYAVAARAMEENGLPLPEMDLWVNSLVVRTIYGLTPAGDGQWVGGDFDAEVPYQDLSLNQLDAVLAGPSSEQAAAWAAHLRQGLNENAPYIYNVLAEIRQVAPQDYRAQTPAPSLWYLARGTRTMYARTSWDASAFWGVFISIPGVVDDHIHWAASNFVFSRGADHLIVDPSQYGALGTLATNAVTADSAIVTGDYAPSQTPWSQAELVWARGTQSRVFAARADFATAFNFSSMRSDIPYAHREWTMLPEGEIVTIDRVRTGSASRGMYVNFHVNSEGTLALSGGVATGTVGGSKVVVHGISLGGATPAIIRPSTAYCTATRGACTNTRFPVDKYTLKVPGPYAVAIHAIDGLDAGEDAALTGSINDDNFDPPPKQNDGVIGAAVYRDSKQSFVVASSAQDGASPPTMTYGVPGGAASRHVVFDAPEDGAGKSVVTAAAAGDRCTISITAGDGFPGRPLVFVVSTAAEGCTVTDDGDVPVGGIPPGGGVTPGGNGGGGSGGGGCGCDVGGAGATARAIAAVIVFAALAALAGGMRRRARVRQR
jgi:hypothetical protein